MKSRFVFVNFCVSEPQFGCLFSLSWLLYALRVPCAITWDITLRSARVNLGGCSGTEVLKFGVCIAEKVMSRVQQLLQQCQEEAVNLVGKESLQCSFTPLPLFDGFLRYLSFLLTCHACLHSACTTSCIALHNVCVTCSCWHAFVFVCHDWHTCKLQ
jgi:hypothetical protein